MIFNCFLCLFIIFLYMITHISNKEKNTKDKLFLVIVFFVMFIIVATRAMNIGNDTLSYLNIFRKCSIYKWDILSADMYYEKGYLFFNVLLSFISSKPRFFMIIMSALFNYAVYRFIKDNSNNYLLSVLMYINLLFFYQSMTMMRQFLALSIVLLFSLKFVKEKKIFKFILSIIIASLFHSSALIAILLYPIYYLKYSKKMVFIIFLSSMIVLITLNQVYPFVASMLNRETYYMTMVGETKLANIISTLIYFVMFLFCSFVSKKGEGYEKDFYLYTLIVAAAIFFISINMAVLSRASQYYAILAIISLPNLMENKVKNNKIIYSIVIVIFMMLYSSIVMIYRPEWNSAFNYKSCIIKGDGTICE